MLDLLEEIRRDRLAAPAGPIMPIRDPVVPLEIVRQVAMAPVTLTGHLVVVEDLGPGTLVGAAAWARNGRATTAPGPVQEEAGVRPAPALATAETAGYMAAGAALAAIPQRTHLPHPVSVVRVAPHCL